MMWCWCVFGSQVFSEGDGQQGKTMLNEFNKMQNEQLGKCNKSNVQMYGENTDANRYQT